jgi:hypothetical protein
VPETLIHASAETVVCRAHEPNLVPSPANVNLA